MSRNNLLERLAEVLERLAEVLESLLRQGNLLAQAHLNPVKRAALLNATLRQSGAFSSAVYPFTCD